MENGAYWTVTASTAVCWLAMIAAPRSPFTARLMSRSPLIVAGLATLHAAMLASGGVQPDALRSAGRARAGLATPRGFAAAWAHMIGFDLLIGRMIWEDGLAEGRDTRLALAATWAGGPTGWLLYQVERRLRPAASS